MFETRFPGQRILTMVLPLSLIWVAIACVFLCAEQAEEASQNEVAAVAAAIPVHEDDCCPLLVTASVRPESGFVIAFDVVLAAPLFARKETTFTRARHCRPVTPTVSPPFARLCTLRI